MKITSSIVVLLLVSAVASLSLSSHNTFTRVLTPRYKGTNVGTLSYLNLLKAPVTIPIVAGKDEEIPEPAKFTKIVFTADPSSNIQP